jgi:DNA-binding IclR family transcriptional regulator
MDRLTTEHDAMHPRPDSACDGVAIDWNPESTVSLRSVENALQLLTLLLSGRPLRVTEAAQQLQVARSTAHRLLVVLKIAGFATQGLDHRYRLGPALSPHDTTPSLRTLMKPYLEQLSQRLNETVHLMVLEGATVRFIDGVESVHALRISSRTGVTLPAHLTSGGKALLAALPPDRLRLLYKGADAAIALPALEDELQRVRHAGYAVNRGESEAGVTAVGAAIVNAYGRAIGAIAIAVPSVRVGAGGTRRLGEIVREAATELSATV